MSLRHRVALCAIALSSAFPAMADWSLSPDESTLNFLSTKNAQITEVHAFERLSGTLSDSGVLEVVVDLTSVNTNIDIRNTRMQEMLFNVASFATASFSATLPDTLMQLSAGESVSTMVDGTLSLHGNDVATSFAVQVSKLDEKTFSVTTTKPTLLSASAFGLSTGVEALQKIAGLQSITSTVPVTFTVTFTG
ncbi:YceI family protein [Alteromonas sp. KUL49]|uniref:YceI family protein n=1 Tax=Alteromonas sp. KUL49 TaxID=2480798 RepID=UPI00102F184A|nr:YceI family protein [Alteromonas sp. KUL49]TAP42187.1 YceI family protein [Alteromonas sp. KUL49]GEA09772.1 hypothetical protein KUL49_01470 [Alteromonas sp. KUL49]